MIGWASALTDCQSMTNRRRDVLFRRLNRVREGFSQSQVSGKGRGEGTSRSMGVRRIDPLSLIHAKKASVIQKVGSGTFEQMSALDQDMLAAKLVQRLSRLPSFGQRPNREAGQPLGFMNVGRDDVGEGNERLF